MEIRQFWLGPMLRGQFFSWIRLLEPGNTKKSLKHIVLCHFLKVFSFSIQLNFIFHPELPTTIRARGHNGVSANGPQSGPLCAHKSNKTALRTPKKVFACTLHHYVHIIVHYTHNTCYRISPFLIYYIVWSEEEEKTIISGLF